MKTTSQTNYTPYQLKLPLELSTVIETTDAVYTFCEVIDHIDLNRYIVKERSKGNSAENMAVVRHLALNALKANPEPISLARKKRRCSYDDIFLADIIHSFHA